MKDNKGMSLVLRVIITGVVLIMIAMTVIFMGSQGLERVTGQSEDVRLHQTAITECQNKMERWCEGRVNEKKKVSGFNSDTMDPYTESTSCDKVVGTAAGTNVTCTRSGAKIGQ